MSSRESRLIKKLGPNPLGNNNFVLPNTSGDHVRSIKRAAPVDDKDLVNKEFVDTLTTDHPHQDVNITASPSFDELLLTTPATNSYKFVSATQTDMIVFQSQESGHSNFFNLMTKDGDGTDNLQMRMWAKALPTDISNGEFLRFIYFAAARKFQIDTQKSGSGTVLPLHLATGANSSQIVLNVDGSITFGTGDVTSTAGSIIATGSHEHEQVKCKMTALGGSAIKLKNETGGFTVQGQVVCVAGITDDAFESCGMNAFNAIGIILEAGVAEHIDTWVVVSGIADVKMDAGGSVRGDRLITSATAGSADVSNNPSAADHFKEIGHSIETRVGAGLSRAVIHFL